MAWRLMHVASHAHPTLSPTPTSLRAAIMAAKTETGLRVFFDSLSQPCRAVLLLLHANKIQYEPQLVRVSQGKDVFA